jgi:peptidyl-prolyl cis-trans isomerase A (cyclophilin A)
MLLGSGCGPKDGPKTNVDNETWLMGRPGFPAVCLSKVSAAGRLGSDQAAYANALAALQEGDAVGARAAIESATDGHPAMDGLSGVLALLEGRPLDARPIYRGLAADWPEDGCVHHTAGVVYLSAGLGRLARGFVRSAIRLQPDEIETRYLNGLVERAAGDEESAARAFRDVVQRSPGHPGASLALASYHLARGDGLLAVPMLKSARDGGLEVGDTLARALYRAGEIGPYISEASRLGWPLGDGGALATADDPLAAFAELLGVGEDQKLIAEFSTSAGVLECELFWKEAPVTVGNFTGLATGRQAWVDPRTGEAGVGPLYSETIFHRVIPEFMIQGGDANGDGTGSPGYRFADEIVPSLRFDVPGRLAMANSGPDTNGSQFFVTDVPTPHLNAKHTIFGQCSEASLEVVRKMARIPRNAQDMPTVAIDLDAITMR